MNSQRSTSNIQCSTFRGRAFSLVEVLAAVALIGVIVFLAIPNIVRVKQDSEENLAIARAEAINLAMASFVQAYGSAAGTQWAGAANDEARYDKLAAYLAFAPDSFSDYLPSGYSLSLPTAMSPPLTKVGLAGPAGAIDY